MVLKYFGQELSCARAVKGDTFIRAYDADGNVIFEASSVSDLSAYALEGGTWSEPEMSETERIEELEALVAEMLFGAPDGGEAV